MEIKVLSILIVALSFGAVPIFGAKEIDKANKKSLRVIILTLTAINLRSL
jgi:hypothetical protein